MNILFFLTPKASCSYLRADDSMRQALERMEASGYAALPILAKDGSYCGTLTEGDLLWAIKNLCTIKKCLVGIVVLIAIGLFFGVVGALTSAM